MTKENRILFHRLNTLTDGLILYASLPLAFWLRFRVLRGGEINVPLRNYLVLGLVFTVIQLFIYTASGLYRSSGEARPEREFKLIWEFGLLGMAGLLSWLFVHHDQHYSRLTLAAFYFLSAGAMSGKRILLHRAAQRTYQNLGNRKRVLIAGCGPMAEAYLRKIDGDSSLGRRAVGYIAAGPDTLSAPWLGGYEALEQIVEAQNPDEVVFAGGAEEFSQVRGVIDACEKCGVKLSLIPFYAEYLSAARRLDDFDGIPMLNIRGIPLDNYANAFIKRAEDVVLAALLLLLTSPLMLVCAAGIRLTSPGPVIFRQKRVGRNKQPFTMYKFRTMRVNDESETAWSARSDSRRTRFGAFLRKTSIDELPQLWNVLEGTMSLVGPRPELPHFVDRFRDEIPLYMVRHQVRPGITGWAQINGLRGDTPIRERVEHDLYYIENWSILFDIQILLRTVFGAKFINDEKL